MNEQENKEIYGAADSQEPAATQTEDINLESADAKQASEDALIEEQHTEMNIESESETPEEDVELMDENFFAQDQKQEEEMQDHQTETITESEPVQPQPKPSFMEKHRGKLLAASCFVLAFAGGLAGTAAGGMFTNKERPVMYQSVDTGLKETSDVKTVAQNCAPSVVEIKTEAVSTHSFFSNAISSGAGSGVILSTDGYIVTNHHVIEGANKVTVTTSEGKSYEAKLIGTDQTSDLAVIKIEAENLPAAIQGSSGSLVVGDTAIAIGNPLGELGGTVTNGIISALDREVTIDNETMHLLQTNAAINPGNSGGGLFNAKGELIGIVNAKSSGEDVEGLGFAIPIDRAKPIIENLMENGYVKDRAALGVSLAASTNPYDSSETVYIASLVKGGAAEQAGLKAGDQILKIDDTEITSVSQVKEIVTSHKAGEQIKVTVLRSHSIKEVNVVLQESSADTQTTPEAGNQSQNPYNGYDYGYGDDDFFSDLDDFFNLFP